MKKILTIIIPTYNMQDYLHKCLDSLIVEPDLMERLEVLVVNDGSKDNSSVIGHEYEIKYPKTFRFIDKENGNYGSCVNVGLAEAQGKFIKILDADDWFDTNGLIDLINRLSQLTTDVDLVLTDYKIVNESGKELGICRQNIPQGVVFDFNNQNVTYYSMHMVTYRVDFLRSIGYCQTEGIFYTDNEWSDCPLYSIRKCIYYPCLVYVYLKGRVDQSTDSPVVISKLWQIEIVIKSLIENRARFEKEKKTLADEHNLHSIMLLAATIYRAILVQKIPSEKDLTYLIELDFYLNNNCHEVWQRLERLVLKKRFPIKYISYWRKKGKVHPLVTLYNKYLH